MIRKKLRGGKLICLSLPLYSGRRRPLSKTVCAFGMVIFSLISLSIVNAQQLQYLEYNALLSSVLHDYSHEGGPHLIGDNLLITYMFDADTDTSDSAATIDTRVFRNTTELLIPTRLSATEHQNHTVGVAFGHENFATIHPMYYNSETMYFATFPVEELYQNIPLNTNTVYYRIIVNGIWTHDQHNPYVIADYRGFKISAYELPTELQYTIYPTQRDGAVHFVFTPHHADVTYLSNTRGQRVFIDNSDSLSVTIAGSFNRWDPYLHPMSIGSPFGQSLQASFSVAGSPHIAMSPASFQAKPLAVQHTDIRTSNDNGNHSDTASSPPVFSKSLSLPPGEHYYYFVVNGISILDPHNPDSAATIDGRIASRIVVQ